MALNFGKVSLGITPFRLPQAHRRRSVWVLGHPAARQLVLGLTGGGHVSSRALGQTYSTNKLLKYYPCRGAGGTQWGYHWGPSQIHHPTVSQPQWRSDSG